jgi:hypothetical protein
VMAQCIWKRAVWIQGGGPFALLAHCRDLSVSLHQIAVSAESSKALIDSTGCGGMCSRQHEIVELVL